MNIAIVGCGTMGKLYADHIENMENMNVTAVYHYKQEKAEAFAREYRAEPYTDYGSMLELAAIDAVIIALPTHLHETYTIQAAQHGKHVFCEKPAALHVIGAENMIQACKKHGVRLFIGHVLRFFPEYEKAASHVQKGELGELRAANAKRFSIHPPENSWFTSMEKSGGIVLDLMIHDIDYLISVMGDVRSVFAKELVEKGTRYVTTTLTFESGAIANIQAYWGFAGGFTTQLEISGTEGFVRNVFPPPIRETPTVFQRADELKKDVGVEIPEEKSSVDPYVKQLNHFYSCVKNGEPFIVKDAEVIKALQVVEAIDESIKSGQEQKV